MMTQAFPPQTVIFLHVPKTAGTTLHHIIMRQYKKSEMYTDEFWRKEAVKTFSQLPAERKSKIKIVWGHLSFGLHQYVPHNTIYFTFLRHPVERVLSHYFYHLRRPDLFELSHILEEENLTMHQILEQGRILDIHNMHTRLLAGLPYSFPQDAYTEEHLEAAKRNLRNHFSVIGLVKKFDESLLLLKKALGWENIYYIQRNTTTRRPERESISQETIALIEKQEQWDMKLYAYAEQLFAQQMSRQPASFAREVKRFQILNKMVYGPRLKIEKRMQQSHFYGAARQQLMRIRAWLPG